MKPKKPSWQIVVTSHAIDRWRERYGTNDTREQIQDRIKRRMRAGLGSLQDLHWADIRRMRNPKHDRYYEESRIMVGDMSFGFYRYGIEIIVSTVMWEVRRGSSQEVD